MKKFFTLSLLLATAISASSANGVNILRPSEKAGGFMASGISTNGEYVCGNSSVWNVSTGEVVTAEDSNVVFESISNTGIAVGNALDYAVSMDLKGNLTYLDDMASGTFSTARGISGDGKIIVGSRFDDAYHQIPCYWEEGTYQPLPLPDKYEDMPDVVEVYSVAAVSINEDGSVIAGNVITGTGAEAVIMWTRNEEGEYEFHPLYSGMMEFEWELEKPYIYMSAQKVSGNGKWISLVLQLNSFEDEGYYAGRYNVKTGEVERAGTFSNYTGDYYATGISNDGTAVGFMERESMQMYGRRAFIWRPDQKNVENLSKYCRGDESVSKLENGETLVYTGISGDSKRIAGFAMEEGIDDIEAFVISLGSSDSSISDIQSDQNYPEGIYDLSGRKLSTRPSSFPYVIIENGKAKKVIQFN